MLISSSLAAKDSICSGPGFGENRSDSEKTQISGLLLNYWWREKIIHEWPLALSFFRNCIEQCAMPIYKVKTCHTCLWMVGKNCGVCAENSLLLSKLLTMLSALIGQLKSPIAWLFACSLSFQRSSAWICTGWCKTTLLWMVSRLVCLYSFITVNDSTMPLSLLSYGFPALQTWFFSSDLLWIHHVKRRSFQRDICTLLGKGPRGFA